MSAKKNRWISPAQFREVKPLVREEFKDDLLMRSIVDACCYAPNGLFISPNLIAMAAKKDPELFALLRSMQESQEDIGEVLPEIVEAFGRCAAELVSTTN